MPGSRSASVDVSVHGERSLRSEPLVCAELRNGRKAVGLTGFTPPKGIGIASSQPLSDICSTSRNLITLESAARHSASSAKLSQALQRLRTAAAGTPRRTPQSKQESNGAHPSQRSLSHCPRRYPRGRPRREPLRFVRQTLSLSSLNNWSCVWDIFLKEGRVTSPPSPRLRSDHR
jgi:hypothetical protein